MCHVVKIDPSKPFDNITMEVNKKMEDISLGAAVANSLVNDKEGGLRITPHTTQTGQAQGDREVDEEGFNEERSFTDSENEEYGSAVRPSE